MMKKQLLILVLASLNACSLFPEQESLEIIPTHSPIRSTTPFTGAMSCMDNLFATAKIVPITLVSDSIDGDPERSPIIKEMVIHAIKSMATHSKAIQYIDFDPIPYSSTYTLLASMMQIRGFIPPEYYIKGALSGETIKDNKINVGGAYSRFSGSFSKIKTLNNVKVNLRLGQFINQGQYVSPQIKKTAAYTFTLVDDRLNARLSGNMTSDLGLSISVGAYDSESELVVIQSLVELAVIELVGTELGVPYWVCLHSQSTQPEFQESVRDWYKSTTKRNKLRFAQQALKESGYYTGNVDGLKGRLTRDALTKFQLDHQLIPSGRINLNFFLALAEKAPGVEPGAEPVKVDNHSKPEGVTSES